MALVAEAWPAKQSARGCSYVALGWQAGVLCAALVTPLLLPSIGWRGMFIVGLLPASSPSRCAGMSASRRSSSSGRRRKKPRAPWRRSACW
jgi:MFS family permease